MRDIKFRAWDKDAELWRYFGIENICRPASEGMLFVSNGNGYTFQLDISTLGQYTGLKDSTGLVDIYEHDIIDIAGKVVGNIYESPQILEEGNNQTITFMGTDAWRVSESVAMGRGCKYAK